MKEDFPSRKKFEKLFTKLSPDFTNANESLFNSVASIIPSILWIVFSIPAWNCDWLGGRRRWILRDTRRKAMNLFRR